MYKNPILTETAHDLLNILQDIDVKSINTTTTASTGEPAVEFVFLKPLKFTVDGVEEIEERLILSARILLEIIRFACSQEI